MVVRTSVFQITDDNVNAPLTTQVVLREFSELKFAFG